MIESSLSFQLQLILIMRVFKFIRSVGMTTLILFLLAPFLITLCASKASSSPSSSSNSSSYSNSSLSDSIEVRNTMADKRGFLDISPKVIRISYQTPGTVTITNTSENMVDFRITPIKNVCMDVSNGSILAMKSFTLHLSKTGEEQSASPHFIKMKEKNRNKYFTTRIVKVYID
ncbi:Major sperm protein [Caenorhabditis elegans]|uniref:Major sperm protein n=1 Tax=Caenorhabditis elegans TaxID=6239 RepID=Q9U1Y1_CAEEL|nr:Major sperm protein [Caenorhabditis elegans]CAB60593.3 Major sperm protein [Caenorhabditis elegans]|eukprot:NP_502568.3 Uncharacterized protein CELE_Y62E10A.3 [Caenorhabditis elegans]